MFCCTVQLDNWDERSVIYDDELASELGRNDDICEPNPCGPGSICEVKTNTRTGDPFTCRWEHDHMRSKLHL